MIKITYDKEADASYIFFQEPGNQKVAKTYLCNPSEINGMINIDFDSNGKIIGIEVLDASKKLPKSIIDNAERIDI